jgi:hypothetical protein
VARRARQEGRRRRRHRRLHLAQTRGGARDRGLRHETATRRTIWSP